MRYGSHDLGAADINIAGKHVKKLIDSGITTHRGWIGFNNFKFIAPNLVRPMSYASMGMDYLWTLGQEELNSGVVTSANVREWTKRMVASVNQQYPSDYKGLRRFQVGNEVNLKKKDPRDPSGKKEIGAYWQIFNNLDPYSMCVEFLDRVAIPCAQVIRAELGVNAEIIAPSLSWDATTLQRVSGKFAAVFDKLDFHPYPNDSSGPGLYRILTACNAATNVNRPLILSEAQMNKRSEKDRLTDIPKLIKSCKENGVAEFIYFTTYPAYRKDGTLTTNSTGRLMDRVKNAAGKTTDVITTKFYDTYLLNAK